MKPEQPRAGHDVDRMVLDPIYGPGASSRPGFSPSTNAGDALELARLWFSHRQLVLTSPKPLPQYEGDDDRERRSLWRAEFRHVEESNQYEAGFGENTTAALALTWGMISVLRKEERFAAEET